MTPHASPADCEKPQHGSLSLLPTRRRGLLLALALTAACCLALQVAAEVEPPDRIISLNPSLTAILISLGAQQHLVGVDDFSAKQRPEVAALPRVGGLFNPSLEAVVELQPDVVVLVPSVEQRDFRKRLEALHIRVLVFENIRFEAVLENIERLGELVGRRAAASERIESVRRMRRDVREGVAKLRGAVARPRAVLVLQRDPLFVVGGDNFIDTMLESAGATNIAAGFDEQYPRVAMEWLIAGAPEVLIDLSPNAGDSLGYWKRWSHVPAVANERLVALDPELISMPGPDLDRSLETLAIALWGEPLRGLLAGATQAK
jgi:iron complex transport system substrate-binding protein